MSQGSAEAFGHFGPGGLALKFGVADFVLRFGHVPRFQHRHTSGEMSKDQFTRFLTEVLGNMADASCDGSIHFVCMD